LGESSPAGGSIFAMGQSGAGAGSSVSAAQRAYARGDQAEWNGLPTRRCRLSQKISTADREGARLFFGGPHYEGYGYPRTRAGPTSTGGNLALLLTFNLSLQMDEAQPGAANFLQ